MQQADSTLCRVRLLALQPLSAEKIAEFSRANKSKIIQGRAMNLLLH